MIDLNERAKAVHAANAKWWRDLDTGARLDRNKGELLMLCISEVSEAMEGERKGLMDDKLIHRPMPEVEMADVKIRLLDFAGGFDLHLPVVPQNPLNPNANKGELLLLICNHIMDIYWASEAFDTSHVGELVAVAINAVDQYCAAFGYDIEGAYREKLAFNSTRADHQIEARKAAGGKRW